MTPHRLTLRSHPIAHNVPLRILLQMIQALFRDGDESSWSSIQYFQVTIMAGTTNNSGNEVKRYSIKQSANVIPRKHGIQSVFHMERRPNMVSDRSETLEARRRRTPQRVQLGCALKYYSSRFEFYW
ncbi:hypothetical protein AB6A40_008174 [Gnathostoma spinigerum]|uniref:Uncharacterized protein n=1 Tax=Gnathostoma spinigerum TaxID=75299 RepID=A0ABD6EYX5_9BILA